MNTECTTIPHPAAPAAPTRSAAAPTRLPGPQDDGRLRRDLARGDLAALKTVHDRYASAMCAVAHQVLGDPRAVAEAVREALVRVWGSRAAATSRPLGPWLCETTRDAAAGLLAGGSLPDPGTSWRTWRIHLALAALPEPDRRLVELSTRHRCAPAEVARRTGLPAGSITSRIDGAHLRLAVALRALDRAEPGA